MSDRVIAVTGGHGVLGQAVVEAALADGLKVAVIDHASGQSAPQGVLELGGVDLTDPAAASKAIDAVAAHFGRLDALLNIAGGFVWQTTDDADPAWARMFALNVTTALNASRAALPHLKASSEGRIVNSQNRADMPDADPAKWVQPSDLARVMLFLASPESRAVTGALIPVTGRV